MAGYYATPVFAVGPEDPYPVLVKVRSPLLIYLYSSPVERGRYKATSSSAPLPQNQHLRRLGKGGMGTNFSYMWAKNFHLRLLGL